MISDVQARAAQERDRFDGLNLSIGKSNIVHQVELFPWIGGVRVPAPACHRGFALDPTRLTPRDLPVTCKLCPRRSGDQPEPDTGGAVQMTLEDA